MNPLKPSHPRWVCALAAVMLLAGCLGLVPAAWAQTDVTTSRITGHVEDNQKAPLPGVTVEARNQETGLTLVSVTDETGFYRLLNLPTGLYTLKATLQGFVESDVKDVRLLIGSTPSINFSLGSASVSESITVTSDVPVVEVTNTQIGTTLQSEQIKAIPTAGTDFKNLVLLTPQTRFDSERGNLSIGGQRGINTNVTVDGVDFNDAFFGGTVGAAEGRAPLSISQESIKEFSVITNGASVEFGRSGGGFVNVITKSGTNSLRGSLFYYNQPQSLISNFADGREPADQKKSQYGFSVGGAAIKDKLFFFASYDNQKQDVTVPILSSVLDPAVFARYPVLSSPDNYIQTRDGNVKFGRLDYQLGSAHRFMLRANLTKYDGENGTSSAQNRAASLNGVEGLDSKSFVGSYSGQWGNNLLNDLNLNRVKEETPREDKGLNLPEFDIAGVPTYGEVSFLPITSTTERKAFGDTLTYLYEEHVFKAGVEYNDTSIDQVFRGNWRGVFLFNNKADFLAGKWNEYRQFGGLGGLSSTEAGRANFGQKETAAFVQDQWFLSPKITLTAGVRWERLDNPDDPVLNPDDRNADGSFRLTAKIPDANNQISPRLGLSWAVDEKTAIRFSAGRFWSRTPAILFAQLFTSNGLRGTQFSVFAPRDAAGNPLQPTDPLAPGWGSTFNPQGVERIDFTKIPTPARPGVFAITSDFDNPYADRFTVSAEREIFPKTSLALDVTYAKGHQLQRLTDINLQYDGTTSANGLPHYSSTRPDPYYGRITTSLSDAESKYTAITATLKRRYADHFSFYSAITYSKDKDGDSNERNFSGIQAEDVNNIDLNYGYSNRDQEWRGVINGVWDSPWWGLSLAGGFRYTTGSPYTATVGRDLNGDTVSTTDRPTVNGDHFDRNSFRQPDTYSLDVRLSKSFNVGLGNILAFVECYNCTDAANRFVPTSNQVWGPNQAPNTTFDQDTGVGTPRTFQLGLRFEF